MSQERSKASQISGTKTLSENGRKVLDFPSERETESFDIEMAVKPGNLPISTAGELGRRHPGWSSAVSTSRLVGGHAVVTVRITASGCEREGIGYAHFSDGKGFLEAEHIAFCEAAAKFTDPGFSDEDQSPERGKQDLSVATCLSDLVTYRQLRSIGLLAKEAGVDADAVSERRFGCLAGELSRSAAAVLIKQMRDSSEVRGDGLLMAG